MPQIEIQRVPGSPKERVTVDSGVDFFEWFDAQDFHSDVDIVINGRKLSEDDELSFPLLESHRIQIFDQPKGFIGDILKPVFKLVTKVFSWLGMGTGGASFSVAESNTKDSPNNKLTGQTNVARTYQARPDVYGQARSYPDLIQESMFEFIDNIKYVTEWMNFGLGSYTVTSVRYSESNLTALAGASYQIFPPGTVIPVINEGFEFDDVDGQEIPGPNESESFPAYTATSTNVIDGVYAGGQISVRIKKQAEFDYFYDITKPRAVTFVINVTYGTASGNVTRDVEITADLFQATLTDDGAIISPQYFYTFYFKNLTGADANTTPTTATVNSTKLIINDNQPLAMGPYFAPIPGNQLWVHFQAQQANDATATYTVVYWKVDDDNAQIAPSQTYSGSISNNSGGQDFRFQTIKLIPTAGYGRYAVQVTRTNNSSDSNSLQLAEIHSVRVRNNEVHANDTLVRVTVTATEQATGARQRKYNALINRHTITYNLSTRLVDYTLRPSRSFADAVAHTWLVIGRQATSTIDLYELYSIAASLPDSRLGYFDYTFDDEDISLGDRVQTICDAARVIAFMDDGVLSFVRDQKVDFPMASFNRSNMHTDEYSITYDMTMPGGNDGVELEYVSPTTNKKTFIRYRITDTGIVEQAAESPVKIKLLGCRNEYQARDRALLEVNRLIHSRIRMACKVFADGEYTYVGMMIQAADSYDENQQAGYIVQRSGDLFSTNENIKFDGDMYVVITDDAGYTSNRYRAYPRDDTSMGFISGIPDIPLNIWDGEDKQSSSRYIIATLTELDSTLWTVTEKKPNSDGTTSLTLAEYSDKTYEYVIT
ncbi:host specificity factor TipJ family phage tail protein [Yersinia rochesterensis]|uniref:host specificity factor TipJ family phage tail protein n=1 Tax=Yersinia rochesterensis TaxID=1604335 RepID=UPI0025AB1C2E|nr:host specificity factor TipJ family phage tail protein [Yersinia rochesterensis]MDN0106744.1 host specificity factor TipJ family phage tail protein [Yersinia rochesterensis]